MPQGNTRTPRALLLAALTVSAIVISPVAALASGPGVTIIGRGLDQPFTLSGDQIAAGSDVSSTSYTKRSRLGGAPGEQSTGRSGPGAPVRAGFNAAPIPRT